MFFHWEMVVAILEVMFSAGKWSFPKEKRVSKRLDGRFQK